MIFEPVTGSSKGTAIDASYFVPFTNIIGILKSRRRWARPVACIGEMKNTYKTSVRKLKGRDCLRDLRADRRIILK
jgi:hypothetical protein